MKLIALALAGLVGLACLTPADACPVVVRRAPVFVKKAVVVKEVVTPVVATVAVPVFVPLYTAAYTPPVVPVAPAPAVAAPAIAAPAIAAPAAKTDAVLEAIMRRLDVIERNMAGPGTAVSPAAPRASSPAGDAPGLAVLTNACAKCHTQGRLNAGTSFAMITPDGKLLPLDGNAKFQIQRRVYKGTMPPKSEPQLTDEQVASVMDLIGSLK